MFYLLRGGDFFSWTLLYYLSEWIIRIVMLFVVPRRRAPQAAMAWLLVIFFVPWPGLVLYWLIGSHRLPKRRIKEHNEILQRLETVNRRFEDHSHIVRPQLGEHAMAAVKLAERLGYMPILDGNNVELIAQTDDFIARLVADIDAARHHVHLLFYIFANDSTGRRVADGALSGGRPGREMPGLGRRRGLAPLFQASGP